MPERKRGYIKFITKGDRLYFGQVVEEGGGECYHFPLSNIIGGKFLRRDDYVEFSVAPRRKETDLYDRAEQIKLISRAGEEVAA